MGFNLGGLASGISSGLQQGSNMQDQRSLRQQRAQQIAAAQFDLDQKKKELAEQDQAYGVIDKTYGSAPQGQPPGASPMGGAPQGQPPQGQPPQAMQRPPMPPQGQPPGPPQGGPSGGGAPPQGGGGQQGQMTTIMAEVGKVAPGPVAQKIAPFVAKQMGVPPDQPIDMSKPGAQQAFQRAMAATKAHVQQQMQARGQPMPGGAQGAPPAGGGGQPGMSGPPGGGGPPGPPQGAPPQGGPPQGDQGQGQGGAPDPTQQLHTLVQQFRAANPDAPPRAIMAAVKMAVDYSKALMPAYTTLIREQGRDERLGVTEQGRNTRQGVAEEGKGSRLEESIGSREKIAKGHDDTSRSNTGARVAVSAANSVRSTSTSARNTDVRTQAQRDIAHNRDDTAVKTTGMRTSSAERNAVTGANAKRDSASIQRSGKGYEGNSPANGNPEPLGAMPPKNAPPIERPPVAGARKSPADGKWYVKQGGGYMEVIVKKKK